MSSVTTEELDYLKPLYFSTIAGASTCLGAAIVFPLRKQKVSPGLMSFSMALAGSVMITITVISIGPECLHGTSSNIWIAFQRIVSFFTGCGLYYLLSKYALPEPEEILGFNDNQNQTNTQSEVLLESALIKDVEYSPDTATNNNDGTGSFHENETHQATTMSPAILRRKQNSDNGEADKESSQQHIVVDRKSYWRGKDLETKEQRKAWRVGLLLFVSLLVHNFPEGLAVAASTFKSPSLGLTVTIGIMIHNIPEGIAIAIPCHAARPNQPWLSFALASASGLAEPIGALFAILFFRNLGVDDPNAVLSLENILAFVGGIMTTVSVFELIPEGRRYHKGWPFWTGNLVGFVVMFITEVAIDH